MLLLASFIHKCANVISTNIRILSLLTFFSLVTWVHALKICYYYYLAVGTNGVV